MKHYEKNFNRRRRTRYLRISFLTTFKKEGFKIYTASDGKIGLEKTNKYKPDLIIADVMMPNMDGIEMCEKIRSNKDFDSVLILFLTARSEDYTHIAVLESGADDFISNQ